jgi:hypothetical protein
VAVDVSFRLELVGAVDPADVERALVAVRGDDDVADLDLVDEAVQRAGRAGDRLLLDRRHGLGEALLERVPRS